MMTTCYCAETKEHDANPFAHGYYDGAAGRAPETAGEVEGKHPHWTHDQVSLYLNGASDGRKGDRWRLDGGRLAAAAESAEKTRRLQALHRRATRYEVIAELAAYPPLRPHGARRDHRRRAAAAIPGPEVVSRSP